MIRVTLALGAAIALCLAAGAQATSPPPTISNCGQLVQHPASLTIACGDANFGLKSLKWASWGKTTATATGLAEINDCNPYCAKGHFHSYRVSVTLQRLTHCPSSLRYTRLLIHFIGARPSGYKATATVTFTCRY